MWEGSDGRAAVFPWSDAPEPPRFSVGDAVANNYKPPSIGTIISVDTENAVMGINWHGETGVINYPVDATYLRKIFPWD